jgi:hypothetical protein
MCGAWHEARRDTAQVSTTTTGRAIFEASAVPVFDPARPSAPPLPGVNTSNNTRTVDTMIAHTY